MTMEKKILVLCEDGIVREESVIYSIELARRLQMPILALMLVSGESPASSIEKAMSKRLLEPIQKAQIRVSKEIRHGDKATELLKYLAGNSSLAAIVWGSDEGMVGKLGAGKPHHWLNRIAGLLPCSIVAPVQRKKGIQR
jgi:hypothetical protein